MGRRSIPTSCFFFLPFKNLSGIEQDLNRGRKGGGCNSPIYQNEFSGEDATEDLSFGQILQHRYLPTYILSIGTVSLRKVLSPFFGYIYTLFNLGLHLSKVPPIYPHPSAVLANCPYVSPTSPTPYSLSPARPFG